MNTLFETRSGRRTGKHMQRDCEKTETGTRSVQCGVRAALLGAAFACAFSMNARGQDYGLDFVTVGAAGNRAPTQEEMPFNPGLLPNRGRVDHEFRITRTEILTSQWLEFVLAYGPYWTGAPNDVQFTGRNVHRTVDDSSYAYFPGWERVPIDPSWEMAARYCNWLHNNKAAGQWAFENGAYDTSTFTYDANNNPNHQLTHSPDARFWIPSYDELIKATYYDPNRYGEGQDGYWLHPNRRMTPNIIAPPDQGGTTNAGNSDFQFWSAGSYPDQTSPWGLLDTSGGYVEMSETADGPPYQRRYAIGGAIGLSVDFRERLDRYPVPSDIRGSGGGGYGFRVAGSIPSSATLSVIAVSMLAINRRKR